jgi:hypothetical protein
MKWPARGLGPLVLMAALGMPVPPAARAGSYVTTIQPDQSQTDDSYLREDGVTEENGDKNELRLKAASDPKNRNIVVSVPSSVLGNKTILQAWLKLTESAANSAIPIETRVHALEESWSEETVSWRNRSRFLLASPWSTPGGTHEERWTDRKLLSEQAVGTEVAWQVGPILADWILGAANYGFLIKPSHGSPDREVVFRSSETGTPFQRPKLVIHYTDEPPAIRSGTAEIQPRVLRTGATNARLSLWLDIDAAGTTPSGAATGIDQITVAHGGALVVTALEAVQVDGASLAGGSFTDNGSSVTIKCPRIRSVSRVRLDLRVTVLSAVTPYGMDLPVTVDDTATPGAWAQALWSGNADGVAGNGDDWVLFITAAIPAKIHIVPATVTIVERLCTSFSLSGEDAQGGTFTVEADSFVVNPKSIGTIGRDGRFCAALPGTAQVIAFWGSLRDTAIAQVTPALTPQVSFLELRDLTSATKALAPLDTMFLDLTVSDGDGFQDIGSIEFELVHAGAPDASPSPTHRASFRWSRSPASAWTLLGPTSGTWQVIPSLSVVDPFTTSTAAQTVRLAFVPGAITRASSAGEWKANVRIASATPPDTSVASLADLDARTRISVSARDTSAMFSAGTQGASRLPLALPTDGRLELRVLANASWSLHGAATDLAGVLNAADTMFVRSPNQRIAWSTNPAGSAGGYLDVTLQALGGAQPASATETETEAPLHLWVDHPATIPAQSYRGVLQLQVEAVGAPAAVVKLPVTATVVSGGQAAQSMLAEVTPHVAPAGSPAFAFDVDLLPQFQGNDTGINRVLVDLPKGYGQTSVTSVTVSGAPVPFLDQSGTDFAEVTLSSRITTSVPVRLRVSADVPTELDSIGSGFVVLFDDAGTPLLPQAGVEGNANGVSDGNSWMVNVVAGPLTMIDVSPVALVTYIGDVTAFGAVGQDAFGHPVLPNALWSVVGGIGAITSAGAFTATATGTGLVIAQSGSIADTASVTVWRQRAIAVRSVQGPSSVYQGQPDASFQVRVENLGGSPVALDSLALSFGRVIAGDADSDFLVVASPSNADSLRVGETLTLAFSASVSPGALTSPLSVNGWASGVETDTGFRLTDESADTSLVTQVRPGGFELSGQSFTGTVRPGAKPVPLLSLRLRNLDPVPHVLKRLTLANRTTGAGDADRRDAALGDVSLFADDGDGVFQESRDTLLLTTTALEGMVHLVPLDLGLEPGGERRLFAATAPPLEVRDGDVLDLAVEAEQDLDFERVLGGQSLWPVDPVGGLVIDGMVADQIQTVPEGPGAVAPGATNAPVFRFRVPPNGYVADQLFRLAVMNLGTARPDSDLARIRAWVDDDGVFDVANDRALGTLLFTGDRWQLTGLAEPVGLDGLWIVVAADLSPLAREERTLQLALPAGQDPGLGLSSGNSGPLDRLAASPQAQTIGDVDRVTFTAMPLPSAMTRPGDRQRTLLHLTATNSYVEERTLTALTLTNITTGPGTQDERDPELQVLTLRADGDGDGVLEDASTDPVLATGFFRSGRTSWSGLSWRVPALGMRHLWVTGDVSLVESADGDVLGVEVSGSNDVGFGEPTTVTAQWPLDSGARWTVDGLVAAQVARAPVPALTLGPGEGPALALDLTVPPNGYQTDRLQGVFLTNLGTATAADLGRVELWRDGGDGSFSAGGDDVSLGVLVPQSGGWQSPFLSSVVAPPGARLFVGITVSAAPTESVTVRLAVPVNGLQFESGNDGPVDAAVENADAQLVSAAPLLATLECPSASTVGQEVVVRMQVRNVGSERIESIVPSTVEITGPASLSLASGPLPASVALDPGAADTISWRFVAAAVGETRFVGSAEGTGASSQLVRRAPAAASPIHRVFSAASRLGVDAVQTMPVTVNPGQTDIVPYSLTFTNPGGPAVSDIRLRGLHVRLETEAGTPIVPSDLLARVSVHEGTNEYLVRTTVESSGNDLDLTLATPLRVTGSEPATLSLRFDLSASTVVPTFRVVIPDSSFFTAEDATSLAPVTVGVVSGAYPLRSNAARVVAPATDVDVTAAPPESLRAGRRTTAVPLLRASLLDRGAATVTSDARVASIRVQVRDRDGQPVGADSRLRAVRIVQPGRVLASVAIDPGAAATVDLALSPPLNLPADSPVEITIEGDVAPDAALGTFHLAIADSQRVEAYDAGTHAPVAVHLAPDPLQGDACTVEADAETLVVAHTARMPANLVVGETGVVPLTLTLRHPGASGTARIRVDTLTVTLRDGQRRPLAASTYLDRVRVLRQGIEVAAVPTLPAGSGVDVPLGGFLIEPGDTATLDLAIDVDASAPVGTLELLVAAAGIHARDANRGSPVLCVPEPGHDLPALSGVGRVVSPSRELVVGLASRMPAVLADDGRPIVAALLTLANRDPDGVGDIVLDHLRLRATDAELRARPLGAVAERVEVWWKGALWASTALLSPDSTTALALAGQTMAVPKDSVRTIEIRWVPRRGATGRVRLGLDRDDVGVVQPGSALLAVQVLPENGQSFPMWSEAGGLESTDLVASYTNFPNPFAAGREATSFAYYLPADARVTLRIVTARGEPVATLLDGVQRGSGQQQTDAWDGRNGRGLVVLNGVYVAELTVQFEDGSAARCLRKVAVLR